MKPELPANELARLKDLESYSILDTLPEQAYDDIVRMASTICGTPIALISLVNQDRQWFKAKVGLDATETCRDASFCAHALHNRHEVFTVPDTHEDSRFSGNALVTGEPYIRFYAGAPLITPRQHVLGTLCVIDHVPRQLSVAQREALMALARQVIALFELRYKIVELQNSEHKFRTFMEFSPAASFVQDMNGRMLYANQAHLNRLERTLPDNIGNADFDLRHAEVAERLRIHALTAFDQDAPVSVTEKLETTHGDTSYWQTCIFPIGTTPKLLGGMAIDITASKLHEQGLEESNRRLELALAKVELLSTTDSLTGLKNRRAFQETLDSEFARAQRYSLELSFLMIDVDNFKQFNDRFGHPAGDDLLCLIGAAIKKNARLQDTVARYGGEEFCVILPNTGSESVLVIAERIRHAVSMIRTVVPVTVSIGVSNMSFCMPEMNPVVDAQELIKAADVALYRAKKDGRNRVKQAI